MSCNNCGGGDPFNKGCGDDKCLCILKIRDNDDCTGTICTEGGNIDFQMPPVAPINGPLSEADSLQEMLNTTSECLKELKEAEDDAGTDDQTASEVSYPAPPTGPVAGTENVDDALDALNTCAEDNKTNIADLQARMTVAEGNYITSFTELNDTITITQADGDVFAVAITHPVVRLVDNGGAFDLTVNGSVVDTVTFPVVTVSESPDGSMENVLVDGVVVGTFTDNDTVSSAHPEYTFADNASGDLEVRKDGVLIATITDGDTISTPHPVLTFAQNATNGTDVLIDGVVVYTVPDTITTIAQTGPTEYTWYVNGVAQPGTIDTIPDTDQALIPGTVTQNADGSTTVCLTTVWVTHPTITAGTPVTVADDVCWTIPPTDTFATSIIAAADGVDVHGSEYCAGQTLMVLANGDEVALYRSKTHQLDRGPTLTSIVWEGKPYATTENVTVVHSYTQNQIDGPALIDIGMHNRHRLRSNLHPVHFHTSGIITITAQINGGAPINLRTGRRTNHQSSHDDITRPGFAKGQYISESIIPANQITLQKGDVLDVTYSWDITSRTDTVTGSNMTSDVTWFTEFTAHSTY